MLHGRRPRPQEAGATPSDGVKLPGQGVRAATVLSTLQASARPTPMLAITKAEPDEQVGTRVDLSGNPAKQDGKMPSAAPSANGRITDHAPVCPLPPSTRTVTMSVPWYCWWRTAEA